MCRIEIELMKAAENHLRLPATPTLEYYSSQCEPSIGSVECEVIRNDLLDKGWNGFTGYPLTWVLQCYDYDHKLMKVGALPKI